MSMLCHKWACGKCGVWLRKRWAEHIFDHAVADGAPVHLVTVKKERWQSLRDQIKKFPGSRGRYARFDLSGADVTLGLDGQPAWDYAIFTTAPVGTISCSAADIWETLVAFAVSLPFDRARISTGRKWKLHKPKTGEWEALVPLGGDMKDTVSVLDRLGLHPTTSRPLWDDDGAPTIVEWNTPAAWSARPAYADHLEWLRLGEVEEPDDLPEAG